MEIWIKVFVWWEQGHGDLDRSLRPVGNKLRRSGSTSPSSVIKVMEIRISIIEFEFKIFIQQDSGYRDLSVRLVEFWL